MTAGAPHDADLQPPLADVEPDEYTPVVRRRPQARKKRKKLLAVQIGTSLAFVLLLIGLAWVGYQASLRITGGGSSKVTDPAAPGYVAEVRPTPVDMVAVTGPEGQLASVLVVTEGDGGEGGTISVLPATVVAPEFEGAGPVFLSRAMEDGGLDGLRQRLGMALTFGFTAAEQVDDATVTDLASRVGPIQVSNVDNLIERTPDGTETVRYRAGEVTLQPEEVTEFLAFAGADETVPNQALRHQAVWTALLEGLKDKDLESITTVQDDGDAAGTPGFLEILPGLLEGDLRFDQVPLTVVPVPDTLFKAYVPDVAALPTFVARTVPFPTAAAPGQRARVRLLNGTTDADATLLAAPKIVAAGGEITLIGNAESFDVTTTRVEYTVEEARVAAEAIAAAMGLQATKAPEGSGSVDVDVVVGSDRTS